MFCFNICGQIPKCSRLLLFLLRFGCQKVGSITFIGKLHKRNMESFSLRNGDKTHESWKPLLNTIHAFRGLSECLHNETCNISFVQSASINLNADLLTPESYSKKTIGSIGSPSFFNSKYRLLPSTEKYLVGSFTYPIT